MISFYFSVHLTNENRKKIIQVLRSLVSVAFASDSLFVRFRLPLGRCGSGSIFPVEAVDVVVTVAAIVVINVHFEPYALYSILRAFCVVLTSNTCCAVGNIGNNKSTTT